MDHTFLPSLMDEKSCAKCKRDFRSHTKLAQCECCSNIGTCEIYKTMLMCKDCLAKEQAFDNEPEEVKEQRVIHSISQTRMNQAISSIGDDFIPMDSVLTVAKDIDQSIRIIPDIFNAKTIALVDVMKAIDADESIENKPYAKAKFSVERIQSLKSALFAHKQQIIEWENEQRAIQVHLNQLAETLRKEEREELRIADINYQPQAPKSVKPRSTTGKTTKRFDKHAALTAANRAKTTIDVIRALMVASPGMTEEQAADKYISVTTKLGN